MKKRVIAMRQSIHLFAGISVKGASIQIDKDANHEFYRRKDLSAREILEDSNVKIPSIVTDLKKALSKRTARRI